MGWNVLGQTLCLCLKAYRAHFHADPYIDGPELREFLRALRLYCIDTEALVFIFNGGSPFGFTKQ